MTLETVLRKFNRKERHWLVCDALGDASRSLDKRFLDKVEAQVKLADPGFKFDDSPYWATDFHIDWLVGALHKLEHPDAADTIPHSNIAAMVKGSQEDIDLVIASGDTLLLIEAKGEGAWSTEQLRSKMARLRAMTGELIDATGRVGQVRVFFLLCSPRDAPRKPESFDCPGWVLVDSRFLHFRLEPPKVSFLTVTRCDGEGVPNRDATHWMIRRTARGSAEDEAAPAEIDPALISADTSVRRRTPEECR